MSINPDGDSPSASRPIQHERDMNAPAKTSIDTKHALSGKILSGAEIVVQTLAAEGVDVVFGYSGGAILPTYDAIFRYNQTNSRPDGGDPMLLVVPANEQGAGFMAAGYARASGKVGVCLVTSGPGATNTVTPVRDCMADSTPIVVICGQVATPAIGSDGFQEAPVTSIMGACAKHVFLVTDPERLEATLRTAFEISRSGRPGPVVVDIPKDVQNWQGAFSGDENNRLSVPGYRARLRDRAGWHDRMGVPQPPSRGSGRRVRGGAARGVRAGRPPGRAAAGAASALRRWPAGPAADPGS